MLKGASLYSVQNMVIVWSIVGFLKLFDQWYLPKQDQAFEKLSGSSVNYHVLFLFKNASLEKGELRGIIDEVVDFERKIIGTNIAKFYREINIKGVGGYLELTSGLRSTH